MMPAIKRAPEYGMREQMLREAVEMIRFASSSGLRVPTSLVETVSAYEAQQTPTSGDMTALVNAHGKLSRLVAPATPRCILLMADDSSQQGRFGFLGPVKLVRQMLGVAIWSVLIFMVLSLAKQVDTGDTDGVNVLADYGMGHLSHQALWLAAAAIGASFAVLYQVNEFIGKRNYDTKYDSSYWVKFILGVVAGFILVALLPLPEPQETGAGSNVQQFAKPTLALLGGFSATAVYRIMTRLVDVVEGIFRGDPKAEAEQRVQAATQKAGEAAAQARVTIAGKLVQIQQQAAAGEDITTKLQELVATLTTDGESDDQPQPAPAPPVSDASAVTVATDRMVAVVPPAADTEAEPAETEEAEEPAAPAPGG